MSASVLSLSRSLSDGSTMWEKAYLERYSYKGSEFLCDPNSWWFRTYSRWVNFKYDLAASPLYLLPDCQTIVLNPQGRPLLYINADTGKPVGKISAKTLTFDGDKLLELKEKVESEVVGDSRTQASIDNTSSQLNDPSFNQERRTKAFFSCFNKTVFTPMKVSKGFSSPICIQSRGS